MRLRRGPKLCLPTLALGLIVATMAVASATASPAPAQGPAADARAAGALLAHPAARAAPWTSSTPQIPWGRLVSGTLVVAALICVGVYVLKRLNGGAPLNRGRYMEVLEARPVGRNVQLILVRVAGRIMLLAFGGDSVTPVAELSEEELPQPPPQAVGLDGFRSLLKRLTGTAH